MSRTTKYAFLGFWIAGNIASLLVATIMDWFVYNPYAAAAYYGIAHIVFCLRFAKKQDRMKALIKTTVLLATAFAVPASAYILTEILGPREGSITLQYAIYVTMVGVPHIIVYMIPAAIEIKRISALRMLAILILAALVAALFYNPFTLFLAYGPSHLDGQFQARAIFGIIGGFVLSLFYAGVMKEKKKEK